MNRDMAKIIRNLNLYKNKQEKFDLSTIEYETMRYITKHQEGVTNKELSNYLYVDKALISRTVKELIKKEYIFEKQNVKDKRSKLFFVTDKSSNYKIENKNLEIQYFDIITKNLSEEEIIVLNNTLHKLYLESKKFRIKEFSNEGL